MLNVREIKPIGTKVLVTEEVYGWDDENAAGIIIHKKGDLKDYQTVLAVGDDVNFVKPGDVVMINFYKYATFENDENSVKVNGTNKVVSLRLDEVDLVNKDNELIPCFQIDQRDIKYILKDFDEVTYEKDDSLTIIPKAPKLILPSNRIKL